MAKYYTYYVCSGTNTPESTGGGTQEPDFRFYFDVSYTQNIANNQSTVVVNKYVEFAYAPSISHPIWANSFINGVERQSEKNMTASGRIGVDTATITHNADGTASFTFQGCGTSAYEVSYHGWRWTNSVTIALPTIPRTSSISSNYSTRDIGQAITLSISRASSNFTHDLTYNVNGGTNYTLATGVATSTNWTIPTSIYDLLPSEESGTINIICTTKNGSTLVGTSSCSLTATVPSSIKPTASLALTDAGVVPSSWGIWLKSKSKIKGTISASAGTGSTIRSYASSANNIPYSSNPFTTDYLTISGSHTVTTRVTDNRGRYVDKSQAITIVDYFNPTISSFSVVRCNADGTINVKGTYAKAIITYSIAPCSNNNTRGLTVTQGSVTKTITLSAYSGTVESPVFSGMETTHSYAFACSLSDYFTSTPQTISLGTAKTVISCKHNEQGVAIGEIAEDDGFVVGEGWTSNFKGTISFKGVPIIWEE